MGWLYFWASRGYRDNFRANVAQSGLAWDECKGAIAQSGMMIAEFPRVWLGTTPPLRWEGLELVESAYAAGKGIVFLVNKWDLMEKSTNTARDYEKELKIFRHIKEGNPCVNNLHTEPVKGDTVVGNGVVLTNQRIFICKHDS